MATKSQNQLACLKASTNLVEALSKFPWGNVRIVPVFKNTPEERKKLVSNFFNVDEAFWKIRNAKPDTVRELGVSLKKKDDGKFDASWWFEIPPGLESVFESMANTRLSNALDVITKLDSPVQAPVPAPVPDPEIADWIKVKLKPHQIPEASHLAAVLKNLGAALCASATGTGKTYSGLGAIFDLNLRPFIICPKAIIPGWERAVQHFGKEDRTLAIVNYDLVKTGKTINKRKSTRSRLGFVIEHVESPYIELGTHYNYSRFKWKLPPDGVLIFDEAHRCFPYKTKILTTTGWMKIGEIVEQQIHIPVASYNFTSNTIEFHPILTFFKIPAIRNDLIKVVHERGSFICTNDHKIWTEEYGYVEANKINRFPTAAHLRMVRKAIHSKKANESKTTIIKNLFSALQGIFYKFTTRSKTEKNGYLQEKSSKKNETMRMVQKRFSSNTFFEPEILFKSMCNVMAIGSTRIQTSNYPNRQEKQEMVTPALVIGKNERAKEPYAKSRIRGENEAEINWPNILSKRGKTQNNKTSTNTLQQVTIFRDQGRIRIYNTNKRSRYNRIPSTLLFGRYSNPRKEDSNRGRWPNSSNEKMEIHRQTKGNDFNISRVVSIKIPERSDYKRNGYGYNKDIFVYNIEVEKNHNYFADGVLVSNCKNRDSINTELLIAAANDHVPTVMLSATIGESPMKLYAIAYKLGIYDKLNAFYSWAQGYGCGDKIVRRNPEVKVFDFCGNRKDLQRLHNALFPKYGTRIRAEDIPDFPENFIMAEIVDMNDDAGKTQQLYDKMELELVKLESEKSAFGSNPLTVRTHFRREIELLKVPILVDMTSDLIESSNSVVIFVSFTATLEALCQKLMKAGLMTKKCCIYGENNAQQNEANRKAFHEDQERVIVCNIQAAREGIDLNDIHGDYARVSLLTPSDNAQDVVQCLGRIPRIGSKTKCVQKIIFCAGTIEEKVAENVRRKINNINALNDGDFAPVFLKDVDLKGR